jgi:crotonobetainyl-CoA:carnitine CoA-transferase CaiB-like acyl-CoA transferase
MSLLSGLNVLDLTLARAGPTCVRHLADWGADVIRIEPPSSGDEDIAGDRNGFDFQNLHRNKRMLQLDLKTAEGHAAFMRLVARADVVVENMRAAVKHRLKISWEDVHAVNPRVVYGSISGFGQTGPYANKAGVDQIAQGMGGLMSITGLPGQGPVRAGIPIADLTAGNLLALGIMMALYERERTGMGRWVQTSLLASQVFMLDFQAARWLMKGEVAGQAGNDHPTIIPTGVFPASDGYFNLSTGSVRHWSKLCECLGMPAWKEKSEWKTLEGRSANRNEIRAAISDVTSQKPLAIWMALFDEAGIPCGPINNIDEVFSDPQVQHLEMAQPFQHPVLGATHLVASPLSVEGLKAQVRNTAGARGADTEEILREAGYSDDDLARLRGPGTISTI